jgi:Protein of unknown function (DUF3499)
MTRQCARPGCSQPAVATLTYDYGSQAAWLDRLSPEPHPMTHDLCDTHAHRMSVPQGWRLENRRMIAPLTPPAPAAVAETEAVAAPARLFHSQLAS